MNEPVIPKAAIYVCVYHVLIILIASVVAYLFSYQSPYNTMLYKNGIISAVFGLLGGTLNASRYVIKAIKDERYEKKKLPWQLLTPMHSAVFAVVAIVFIKSGIHVAVDSAIPQSSHYTEFIIVVSFSVGFATEIFIKKLIAATESLFGEKDNIMKDGEKTE